MDLKALRKMARKQREAEEENEEAIGESPDTSPSAVSEIASEQFPDEVYIPIEDEETDELPGDSYSEISSSADMPSESDTLYEQPESLDKIISKCFTDDKAYSIEIDRLLPFRFHIFTNTGDISALKSDVARKGITEPLMVRSAGNGEYEILSGNRRCAAAEQLMWTKVPCYIGSSDLISDEYALRIVIDSNRHRFSELTFAEKIRVTGIIGEKSAAQELHLTSEQAELFGRLNALEQYFLDLLDSNSINISTAELIAEMSTETQSDIIDVLKSHPEMKITAANAKELHDESNPTTVAITKILKPKPPVKISIPAELVAEYMNGKTPEELTGIVSSAIRKFFEEDQNGEAR